LLFLRASFLTGALAIFASKIRQKPSRKPSNSQLLASHFTHMKEVTSMFRQPFSWSDLERLRKDLDQMFDGSYPRFYRQRARTFPAVNIWTNENEGAVLTAELPGVDPDDINISVTADTLTLTGSRKPVEDAPARQYHRREQNYGDFTRAVQLPFTINNDQVQASVSKGVLRVTLPRAEAEKPKQISVKAGS
jgi:HSP20 family protein